MAKYVLAADYTLMTDYRNVPLATFFSCIPTDYWHSRLVFRILADPPKLDPEGGPSGYRTAFEKSRHPSFARTGATRSSSPTLGASIDTSMTRRRWLD